MNIAIFIILHEFNDRNRMHTRNEKLHVIKQILGE